MSIKKPSSDLSALNLLYDQYELKQVWRDLITLPAYSELSQRDRFYGGLDYVGRPFYIQAMAAIQFFQMCAAAEKAGIILVVVSAFRSFEYQAQLFKKRLQSACPLSEALSVSALPGFSEHHTGRAVDFSYLGELKKSGAVLTEAFENSEAYRWLNVHGASFGFTLTYPRNNKFGMCYEPWHWCYHHE